MSSNLTQLAGVLFERGALRHTPAGIPVIEFVLTHHSTQIEATIERQVTCDMECVAMGTTAHLLANARLGDTLQLAGFLAARSLKRRTPVLHVNTIEFFEGNEHGIQTER